VYNVTHVYNTVPQQPQQSQQQQQQSTSGLAKYHGMFTLLGGALKVAGAVLGPTLLGGALQIAGVVLEPIFQNDSSPPTGN